MTDQPNRCRIDVMHEGEIIWSESGPDLAEITADAMKLVSKCVLSGVKVTVVTLRTAEPKASK